MIKIRKNKFKIVNLLISKPNFAVLTALVLFFESLSSFAAAPGVDPNIKEAITAQAKAAIGYEMAAGTAMIDMPSSVAATTCLDQAITASADVAGEIFSGKISSQAKESVGSSLESHFENYKWDNILSYDTELKVDAEFHVNLNISIGGDSGPTVKNVECASGATLWEAKKEKAGGSYPVLAEAIAQAANLTETETSQNQSSFGNDSGGRATPGNRFITEWTADSNDGVAAAESLNSEVRSLRERYNAMDRDFNEEADPCELLKSMAGDSFNCDDIK